MVQSVDGGIDPQDISKAGLEAVRVFVVLGCDSFVSKNLDIQYTVGIATGVPVLFISVGNRTRDGIGGWIDAFDFLSAQQHPPQVNILSKYS